MYGIGTHRFISTGNMIDTGNGVFPVYYDADRTNPLNPQATFLADTQHNFAWAGSPTSNTTSRTNWKLGFASATTATTARTRPTRRRPFWPNVPGFPQGYHGPAAAATPSRTGSPKSRCATR